MNAKPQNIEQRISKAVADLKVYRVFGLRKLESHETSALSTRNGIVIRGM